MFRNPPEQSAGALIDSSGCKGWRQGDAEVSTKHANFFVNLGQARAQDLLSLIQRVQERVQADSGILLHPEVRMIEPHAGWMPW